MTLPAAHPTAKPGALAAAPLDVEALRKDFPALAQLAYGKPLVYLDNAATTQKPQAVIDAVTKFYAEDCANVHRGVHLLSQRATDVCDRARLTVIDRDRCDAPVLEKIYFFTIGRKLRFGFEARSRC